MMVIEEGKSDVPESENIESEIEYEYVDLMVTFINASPNPAVFFIGDWFNSMTDSKLIGLKKLCDLALEDDLTAYNHIQYLALNVVKAETWRGLIYEDSNVVIYKDILEVFANRIKCLVNLQQCVSSGNIILTNPISFTKRNRFSCTKLGKSVAKNEPELAEILEYQLHEIVVDNIYLKSLPSIQKISVEIVGFGEKRQFNCELILDKCGNRKVTNRFSKSIDLFLQYRPETSNFTIGEWLGDFSERKLIKLKSVIDLAYRGELAAITEIFHILLLVFEAEKNVQYPNDHFEGIDSETLSDQLKRTTFRFSYLVDIQRFTNAGYIKLGQPLAFTKTNKGELTNLGRIALEEHPKFAEFVACTKMESK